MNGYELSYVALSSANPAGVAEVLGEDLGMCGGTVKGTGGPDVFTFAAGRSTICVFDCDHPLLDRSGTAGLDHIALAVADPEAAANRHSLGTLGRGVEQGIADTRQVRVDPDETAGVHVRFAEPITTPGNGGGMIERIDHLGVASLDVSSDEQIFAHTLGCPVESRQTDMEISLPVESFTSDKYGVVYHNRTPNPLGGLRVLFVSIGDCELEFLQEFDPHQDRQIEYGHAGTTMQDQGAIGRFVSKRGRGLHHIALKTPDIDSTLAYLTERGRTTIDQVGRPGSRRARIGFLHPKALGGILLHFVERTEI